VVWLCILILVLRFFDVRTFVLKRFKDVRLAVFYLFVHFVFMAFFTQEKSAFFKKVFKGKG
jgi:hypothetical protein